MQKTHNGDRDLSIPKVESCIKPCQEEDIQLYQHRYNAPIGLGIHRKFQTYQISSSPRDKVNVDPSYSLSFDYSPVILTVNSSIFEKERKASLYDVRTDWEKFRQLIDANTSPNISLKTEDDIVEVTEMLVTNIQHAAWESTSEIKKKAENISNCPKHIKEMVLRKRNVRRRWQTSRHPEDETKLKKISKELKKLLYRIKNQNIQDFVRSLSAYPKDDYSL